MKYDYLIVGSGLFGSTFAYLAKQAGKTCLVVEKRDHLGGNIFTEEKDGIHVHKYGAHIFHTNDKEIWDFVNRFVEFNRYTNSPLANYHGELYNLPFNMNTFYQMWGVTTPMEAREKIEEQRSEALASLEGRAPQNLEEQALCLVGKDIYRKLIKEYTEKQWGRECKDLPSYIIKRLPVRWIYDNNYFDDQYQGIPIGGYNKLVVGLLEGVECRTHFDFFMDSLNPDSLLPLRSCWSEYASHLVYTGAIDQYFDFCQGHLNWRTVRFETEVYDTPNFQGNAVINYTSHDVPFTRIIEHKHFEKFGQEVFENPKTVISKEYSTEFRSGKEPFYPVNDEQNNTLADAYRKMATKEKNVIFGGRLAEYKYYDMAPVIRSSITAFRLFNK